MEKPNYLLSILQMKCPRCRRGKMFLRKSSYSSFSLNKILEMQEPCHVCGQKFELEPGFWYGTGYVSYALAIALSVATFIAFVLFFGISYKDNRVYYWLSLNTILLLLLQPWLMRLSRVIYLYFFVYYDNDYKTTKPKEFDMH